MFIPDKEGADPQARTGALVIQGESFPTKRLDLPTIAETFKTYDNCNLVKSADIGQVIVGKHREDEVSSSGSLLGSCCLSMHVGANLPP